MKRLLFWCLALVMLCGCSSGSSERTGSDSKQPYYIYGTTDWKNNNMQDAVTTKTAVTLVGDTDQMIDKCVALLLDEPDEESAVSPFPPGTTLLSRSLENGVLTLDFSDEASALNGVSLIGALTCVTLTLCPLPGVDAVRFRVDGRVFPPPQDPKLPEKQYTEADFIVDGLILKPLERQLTLYFVNEMSDALTSEVHVVVLRENEPAERYVLVELLNGPKTPGLLPVISDEINPLSISTENGVCYVNFPALFYETDPPAGHSLAIQAIVRSLTSLPGITSVQFLTDGEEVTARFGDQALNLPITP